LALQPEPTIFFALIDIRSISGDWFQCGTRFSAAILEREMCSKMI
jgi:hypothetical protein